MSDARDDLGSEPAETKAGAGSDARPPTSGWRRRFLVWAALLTILLVPMWTGWLARQMMFPGSRRPLPTQTPPEWELRRLEVVDYATADGIPLKGVVARAARPDGQPDARVPTLVYFHGNAESAADNVETGLMFARRGFDTFIAEYRGYGLRPGTPTEQGLIADGRAALEAVERVLGVDRAEVILVGRSLGTGVASALAGEGHGTKLILLSPYTSMVDMAKTMVPGFVARIAVHDRFDSLTALAAATQPVLVVHGTADPVIPVAQGKALAASLGERAKLVLLDGIGHNDLFLAAPKQTILAEVARFLGTK